MGPSCSARRARAACRCTMSRTLRRSILAGKLSWRTPGATRPTSLLLSIRPARTPFCAASASATSRCDATARIPDHTGRSGRLRQSARPRCQLPDAWFDPKRLCYPRQRWLAPFNLLGKLRTKATLAVVLAAVAAAQCCQFGCHVTAGAFALFTTHLFTLSLHASGGPLCLLRGAHRAFLTPEA